MSKYYSILDRKYLMGEIIDDNIKNPIIVSYNEKRVQVREKQDFGVMNI